MCWRGGFDHYGDDVHGVGDGGASQQLGVQSASCRGVKQQTANSNDRQRQIPKAWGVYQSMGLLRSTNSWVARWQMFKMVPRDSRPATAGREWSSIVPESREARGGGARARKRAGGAMSSQVADVADGDLR